IYTFTGTVGDPFADLEDDLVARFRAGVKVRGVFERSLAQGKPPYQDDGFSGRQMDDLGMNARLDANPTLMHAKVTVVDQRWLAVGSANYTGSADRFNDENVVFFDSPAAARRAVRYIQWLHGLTVDEGTRESPAADVTPPARIAGVTLADAPGSGVVTV